MLENKQKMPEQKYVHVSVVNSSKSLVWVDVLVFLIILRTFSLRVIIFLSLIFCMFQSTSKNLSEEQIRELFHHTVKFLY